MEYVIVGSGALGQSFAGLLAHGGNRVTLLATPRGEARLRERGAIRLRGAVDVAVKVGEGGVRLTTDASDLPRDAGVLFTTKGQDLPAAVESVRSAAGQRIAWTAGVQNGMVKDDLLASTFGADRVVGAVTILGAARHAGDYSVQVMGLGATYLGELNGGISERVSQAAEAFQRADIPTYASEDISSVLWSKACNATGVFGTTVLARASNTELFANPHLMRAYLALVRETAAVASAYGVQVGDYLGFPPIRTYAERDEQAIIDQVKPNPNPSAPSYASMTNDLLAGSPMEVDAVFGDIVERADRKAVAVPCLRLVRDVIRGIDPGHAAR